MKNYATAAANKDAVRIYDIISTDCIEAKGKEMDIVSNSAYGKLSGPNW